MWQKKKLCFMWNFLFQTIKQVLRNSIHQYYLKETIKRHKQQQNPYKFGISIASKMHNIFMQIFKNFALAVCEKCLIWYLMPRFYYDHLSTNNKVLRGFTKLDEIYRVDKRLNWKKKCSRTCEVGTKSCSWL